MFKKLKSSMVISLLIGVLSALLYYSALGGRVEFYFHDLWYLVRGVEKSPDNIVVVAIDEQSYKNLSVPMNGAWPRALHAKLLDRLAHYGAKKVIFDVLFLDPSADPVADENLAQSIAKLPVVLGAEWAVQQVGGAGGSFSLEDLLEPYKPFQNAAKVLALVTLPSEEGFIRNFFTQRTERIAEMPSLGEAGADFKPNSVDAPDQNDLINYYGAARTIPTYSVYQVLEDERPLDRSLFEGKTIYVGLSLRTDVGPAQKEVFKNPYGRGGIFGVEVHATAAGNLASRSWIKRLSPVVEILLTGILAVLFSVIIFSITPVMGGAVVGGWVILWSAAAYFGFLSHLFIPGAFLTFIAVPFVFLLATFQSFVTTRRSELKLRSAFEMYVSPDMVAQLQSKKSGVSLGGQKIWATAMFTDIAGFTDIAEELPPDKTSEMLNEYFTAVMDVVFEHKGTLIKFIGDAVFVIWGAPVQIDNHAEMAMKAAAEIQACIERFNAQKKYPALNTRIGINTGPMVVGNLGSNKRFDYTAIGDSVNLASRVESLNKYFATTILLTQSVRKDAVKHDGLIPVGDMQVKGKKEAVSLYTLLDPPATSQTKQEIEAALEAFCKREWDAALKHFEEVKDRETRLVGVVEFYRKYIEKISKDGVSVDWKGEIRLDSK